MIVCSSCGYENRVGLLFCEDCGANITNEGLGATIPTRRMPDDTGDITAKATWGTAHVGVARSVLLHIRDTSEPITLHPTDRLVFGRSDETNYIKPDVDLTPYGALEKGVSRNHAALEFSEDTVVLVDIGSSNGTFLNGQRLPPEQPRVLRDGDEIRLGKLIAHVYFK